MNLIHKIVAWLIRTTGNVEPKRASDNMVQLGALIDLPDPRDKKYEMPVKAVQIPNAFTLLQYCSPIKNQGKAGSCVAFAAAELLFAEFKKNLDVEFDASEAQLYLDARKTGNLYPNDVGSYPRDMMKVLLHAGAAPESLHRYNDLDINKEPSALARSFQRFFNAKSTIYFNMTNIEAVKQEIYAGHHVMVNIPVYASFFAATTDIPTDAKNLAGYHEIALFGYDNDHRNPDGTKGAFAIQNSWGISWGQGGRSWLPYSYFKDPNCTQSSFYSIRITG